MADLKQIINGLIKKYNLYNIQYNKTFVSFSGERYLRGTIRLVQSNNEVVVNTTILPQDSNLSKIENFILLPNIKVDKSPNDSDLINSKLDISFVLNSDSDELFDLLDILNFKKV